MGWRSVQFEYRMPYTGSCLSILESSDSPAIAVSRGNAEVIGSVHEVALRRLTAPRQSLKRWDPRGKERE